MTRLSRAELTPADGAMNIEAHRAVADAVIEALAERAERHLAMSGEEAGRLTAFLRQRGQHLVDLWTKLVHEARHEHAAKRRYSRFDKDKSAGRALLTTALDDEVTDRSDAERELVAPTSMRDVEPSVHLWLERRRSLGGG
ncbi:MAG: hypothetical protein M5U28_23300 [Sandaracinaceae bacterium]|nr:hypothetical protein [Sandaracinaceae bacterium]